jgi:integrase
MSRPKLGVRERALSDAEIPIAWSVAETVGYPFGPFVRLLLLTGCRRGEIAGLQWPEINFDQNTITVPADRYKTERTLVVPLSPPTKQLIDNLPRHAEGPFVFSTTGGRRPISGYSKMKRRFDAALSERCEAEGREPFDFDLHDLRRTVRTNLSALRVPPHVAEAVLGHVVTGVQKHYDKWTYVDEKREALESWARKLQSLIVPGSNWCPSAELDNLVFRCG